MAWAQNGGCGGSGHAHLREWADPKDHKRVQNDVPHQPDGRGAQNHHASPLAVNIPVKSD